jgi:hypothetical protein
VTKGRAALKTGQSEVRLHENFLGEVLCIVSVTYDVAAVSYDSLLVLLDKLLESTQITFWRFSRPL